MKRNYISSLSRIKVLCICAFVFGSLGCRTHHTEYAKSDLKPYQGPEIQLTYRVKWSNPANKKLSDGVIPNSRNVQLGRAINRAIVRNNLSNKPVRLVVRDFKQKTGYHIDITARIDPANSAWRMIVILSPVPTGGLIPLWFTREFSMVARLYRATPSGMKLKASASAKGYVRNWLSFPGALVVSMIGNDSTVVGPSPGMAEHRKSADLMLSTLAYGVINKLLQKYTPTPTESFREPKVEFTLPQDLKDETQLGTDSTEEVKTEDPRKKKIKQKSDKEDPSSGKDVEGKE